jgi:glycosyltransferase involved in cell wall biosynthesis
VKIAFYAPMKPPTSPVPSGDRLIGRLLIKALADAGHTVELMSRFRSFDGVGSAARQRRLQAIGLKLANRIARRQLKHPVVERPKLWFTYHLFHKAPDWIGPQVAKQLSIPYVVAEASYAPKQAGGPWETGHASVRCALAGTDLVIGLNRQDASCVIPCLAAPDRYKSLRPFLESTPFEKAREKRAFFRDSIVQELGLDAGILWLLTVAMMRPGDKIQSYEILAKALSSIAEENWILLIAGSGPQETQVQSLFSELTGRVFWLGKLKPQQLAGFYAAADIFAWPAVKESPGMCFLEAQAAGIPVVGSDYGGIPDIVINGKTGLLARHLDIADFAACVKSVLTDKDRRHAMGVAAANNISENHKLATAGQQLNVLLSTLVR